MMKPPYKNHTNMWYTAALFYERWLEYPTDQREITDTPPFTLYQPRPGMICARTTFVELNDPTGYKWAMKYLGDWEHWKVLLKSKWFQEALGVWQEELKMKTRSEALDTIKEISISGQPAQALVAAKYLAEAGWETKEIKRGRPSKEEVSGELKRATEALKVENDDAARIGLRIVK